MPKFNRNNNLLTTFESFLRKDPTHRSSSEENIRQNLYRAKRLIHEYGAVSYDIVEQFRYERKMEGGKDESANKYVTVGRLWGHCFNIPKLLELKYVRKTDASPKIILSIEQLKQIINCPPIVKQHTNQHNMFSLFFATLAVTGCRPGEIAKLTLDRINWGMNAFLLESKNVKTRDDRPVPITGNIASQIKARIKEVLGDKRTNLLFSTKNGNRLRNQDWNRNFKARLNFLDIPKVNGLSVKSFRDGYITEMLQTPGVNLFDVMYQVGHTSPNITQKYYKYTMRRKLEVANMHPLAHECKSHEQKLEQFRSALFKILHEYKDLDESVEVKKVIKALEWY